MASNRSCGLFALPRHVRDDIYRKVLGVAHPLYLFKDSESPNVEIFAPEKPRRWLALLFTNRQLHAEASAILYGFNHFDVVDTTPSQADLLQAFLDGIGAVNAAHLSHISISFPVIEAWQGAVMFRESDLRCLNLLREQCTGLETLEALVQRGNSKALIEAGGQAGQDSRFVWEGLAHTHVQFKAIRSLRKIIVRFYSGKPTPKVTEQMQRYGWVILIGR